MNFSRTTLVSLLLLSQSALCAGVLNSAAVSACQSACATPGPKDGVFGYDLKYYASNCLLNCSGPDNFSILDCQARTQAQCETDGAEVNRRLVCYNTCYRTINGNLFCGTEGITYSNLCKAVCDVPSTLQVYSCNSDQFPRTDCARKCANLKKNKPGCKSLPDLPVCATDGNIYRNECEMADPLSTYPVKVAVGAAAGASTDPILCYQESLRLFPYVGVSKPVKPAPTPTA